MTVRWHEVVEGFTRDGALRDIYVFGASAREWQAVYEAVRATYPVHFHDLASPPDDVRELFCDEEIRAITVDPDGLAINCHFFGEQEIEFDLWPENVASQESLDAVCRFMRVVGTAARKDAVLVLENLREWVILRFDLKTDTVFAGADADRRIL